MIRMVFDKFGTIKKYIIPKNETVLYLSIIISTVLPLLVSYLFYPVISEKLPVYSDLIAGATTWSGYNKPGDLTLFYIYLSAYLLLLILTPLMINFFVKKNVIVNVANDEKNDYPMTFLKGFGIICLTNFAVSKVMPFKIVIVFSFFYLIYHLLKKQSEIIAANVFKKICLLSVFAYFNVIAGVVILNIITKRGLWLFSVTNNYVFITVMLSILIAAKLLSTGRVKEKTLDILLILSQILLPALFLTFYKFRYIYKGEIITQYYSEKLKYACLFAAVALILYNLYISYKRIKKNSGNNRLLLISSVISLSAFFAYSLPHGSLITDYYHYGEMTVPFHQLIRYGSLPLYDYIPAHGGIFFDYFRNLTNYLFFQGEYATLPAAYSISQIFLAITASVLITRFVKGEVFSFILSILCANAAGVYFDRWFGVFVMMIILYSEKVRNNPIKLLWWWTAASIFAISWYPTIGGCASVSFLPLIIYSFICKENSESLAMLKDKFYRRKIFAMWIPLIIIGCLFIPIFFKMFEFVRLNLHSNLEANGSSAAYAVVYGAINFFGERIVNAGMTLIILPLGFTLVVGLLLIYSYKNGKLRAICMNCGLQILLLVFLASNYMFGRVGSNLGRAISAVAVISITIIAAIGNDLITNSRKISFVLFFIITGITFGGSTWNLFEQHKKVYAFREIPSEFERLDGKKAGIKNLGTVYASESEINFLTDTNYVLKNHDSFLDLSERVAYHAIFDKKNPVPNYDIYMTLNYAMQINYLDAFKNNQPEIILIYPHIVHDMGTPAFRAYPVFRHIIEQGYSPYKYNDVIFLLSKDSRERGYYEKAGDEFTNIMHIKNIGYLPILWGSEEILNNRVINNHINPVVTETHNISELNGIKIINGNDGFIVYQFDAPINGLENDFIKVSLSSEYKLRDESDFQIFWADDNEEFNEEKSFLFKANNGSLLIPMGTSPYWSFSNNIKYLRLDFPATIEGKRLPEVKLEIYRYSNAS